MFTNAFASKILDEIAADCYLALHFDDPELAGHYASEVSGGGYKRVKGIFTECSSRAIWLDQPVSYSGLLPTRITHIGGWNELTNGDLIWTGKLPIPVTVLRGGGFQLKATDAVVSLV